MNGRNWPNSASFSILINWPNFPILAIQKVFSFVWLYTPILRFHSMYPLFIGRGDFYVIVTLGIEGGGGVAKKL